MTDPKRSAQKTTKRTVRRRKLPPVETGLKGRCPACGEGNLFAGFLKFAEDCEACGLDLRDDDAGDGPAFFAMFTVLIIIVPMALAFGMITGAPMWLVMLIWSPIIIGACLWLLRLLRGVMFNIAWRRNAREVRAKDIAQ